MQWVKIYSDYIYFTEPPWETEAHFFCHLLVRKPRWLAQDDPVNMGRAGVTPRPLWLWVQFFCTCTHVLTIPLRNKGPWSVGWKLGCGVGGTEVASAPSTTVTLTCWQLRHWQLLAEQACSLSPECSSSSFCVDRRLCSLGCLVLQPRILERGTFPESHKCNLLVYFLTHVLPLYLVREIQHWAKQHSHNYATIFVI